MNVKNNKRRKESRMKIGAAFMELLQTKDIAHVTVSDICKKAEVNRSTFYSNYLDVYDLADKMREHLEEDLRLLFADSSILGDMPSSIRFFTHIRDNQIYYRTYFKLGYDNKFQLVQYDKKQAELDFENKNIKYHVEFFRNGLNSIIKMWLEGGCEESPEEMADILRTEYQGRR